MFELQKKTRYKTFNCGILSMIFAILSISAHYNVKLYVNNMPCILLKQSYLNQCAISDLTNHSNLYLCCTALTFVACHWSDEETSQSKVLWFTLLSSLSTSFFRSSLPCNKEPSNNLSFRDQESCLAPAKVCQCKLKDFKLTFVMQIHPDLCQLCPQVCLLPMLLWNFDSVIRYLIEL